MEYLVLTNRLLPRTAHHQNCRSSRNWRIGAFINPLCFDKPMIPWNNENGYHLLGKALNSRWSGYGSETFKGSRKNITKIFVLRMEVLGIWRLKMKRRFGWTKCYSTNFSRFNKVEMKTRNYSTFSLISKEMKNFFQFMCQLQNNGS